MDLPADLELPLTSGAPWWYWLGNRPALDFVNTLRERWNRTVETLVTPEDLAEWLRRAALLEDASSAAPTDGGRLAAATGLLPAARAMREAIDRCVTASLAGTAPAAADLATIDAFLPDAAPLHRLAPGPDGQPLLAERTPADPLRHAVARVALDAAELLGDPAQRARLRVCASQTCSARFYDRSPAARRRWCSMGACGNVAKARRHRARGRLTTKEIP